MALLCYNRGCGQNYNPDQNKDGKILCDSSCTGTYKNILKVITGKVSVGVGFGLGRIHIQFFALTENIKNL